MQQLPGLQVGLACCADNIADSGKEPPSGILRICNMHRPGVFLRAFTCAVAASVEKSYSYCRCGSISGWFMARAFLFVLDSFGIGGAPDAAEFGDDGADTLGHIAEFCAAGVGDRQGLREGPLTLPNMAALGLLHAAKLANKRLPAGMPLPERVFGLYGAASEVSRGKDTPSGHWEIAGTPVAFEWGYFPAQGDAFPADLVEAICREGGVPGILGNCHASGTDIIAQYGQEHMRTGKPICYTSSDSRVSDRRARAVLRA